MRLAPNTDTVPASVNRYLLPHERQVISVHEHPAVLIPPIALVLLGLAIAGLLSNYVAHGNTDCHPDHLGLVGGAAAAGSG